MLAAGLTPPGTVSRMRRFSLVSVGRTTDRKKTSGMRIGAATIRSALVGKYCYPFIG
jgi:hypothetical protein